MAEHEIIIAVSGSGDEHPHIQQGISWAAGREARIRIVHVVISTMVPVGYAFGGLIEAGEVKDDVVVSAQELKDYITKRLEFELDDSVVSYEVRQGDDAGIITELSKNAAGLVLGHHHANALMRFLAPGLDQRILDRVECPVLIVPEGDRE